MDWAGVSWTPGFVRKGFGFISPEHYLATKHFGGSSSVTVLDQTGSLQTQTQSSVENTTYGEITSGQTIGDLALGTLTAPINEIPRYGVIDLNSTSSTNTPNNYLNLQLLVYGHGGSETSSTRVSSAQVEVATASGLQHRFLTSRDDVQLEAYDSGSPCFANWTNPNGDQELAIIGNNVAISESYNFHNFIGTYEVISKLNELMNDDGYALRVVGNSSYTWEGDSSSDITSGRNWGRFTSINTSDTFVLFNPTSASSRSVDISSAHNLRGFYFKSSTTSDAFTFTGSATLTIGRGGITNYDADQQSFAANIALDAPQYWDAGPGGLSISHLDNGGHLLEFTTEGSSTISGTLSGSGGLALSGGVLTLSGTSSYTGSTWVHEGELQVTGDISTSNTLKLASNGTVSGSGQVPSITGDGTVSPGNSPGILTSPSVTSTEGLDFAFEFTEADAPPLFSNTTASDNDLLRLTATTPFISDLDSTNTISIYLNADALQSDLTFIGGFFTDQSADFLSAISNAQFEFYIADDSGGIEFEGNTYSLYQGSYRFTPSTKAQDADFGSGTVSGRILQLLVEPDITQYAGWKIYHDLTGDNALDTADIDNDGAVQIEEFAFGGDPSNSESGILPTITTVEDSGSTYLEISYTRPTETDLTYIAQTTTDLSDWPLESTGIDSPTVTVHGDGTQMETYRRTLPIESAEKAFLRISMSAPISDSN
ncbi:MULTISPECIES: hypothetical protein [unclassified Lentimonas]|uniref:hypothetical protein n=1 Tax=unclassified Lentimonas TaxID=2630993 RepID=UPI00138A17AD|nr:MULTISPECIES: hypothetical protein [unclassified Lentimonas]